MARPGRSVDLTERLGLAERPTITVGDVTLTVDNSAMTVIRVFELVGDGREAGVREIAQACELLFDEGSREALEGLRLDMADYAQVVRAAMELAVGGGEDGPKAATTPATT